LHPFSIASSCHIRTKCQSTKWASHAAHEQSIIGHSHCKGPAISTASAAGCRYRLGSTDTANEFLSRTRAKFGDHSFCYSDPAAWNFRLRYIILLTLKRSKTAEERTFYHAYYRLLYSAPGHCIKQRCTNFIMNLNLNYQYNRQYSYKNTHKEL